MDDLRYYLMFLTSLIQPILHVFFSHTYTPYDVMQIT